MTRYVRRYPEVEAQVFTEALGTLTHDGKKLVLCDAGRELGITYAEGKGYQYRGHKLRFGQYVVATPGVKAVWNESDFEAQFKETTS